MERDVLIWESIGAGENGHFPQGASFLNNAAYKTAAPEEKRSLKSCYAVVKPSVTKPGKWAFCFFPGASTWIIEETEEQAKATVERIVRGTIEFERRAAKEKKA